MTIHPTAIIATGAELGSDVTVAPYAVIEDDVIIGDGTQIGAHALIGAATRIGRNCRIFNGASVGTIPQDLKFKGEYTTLHIGDNAIIREFCTINRGTQAAGKTVIGNNCALLAYCHVGHDCIIGDNLVASNSLAMAGHVEVGNHVGLGGGCNIHQFCRIGDHAFIAGGGVRLLKDAVPFAMIGGDQADPRVYGINSVGLERRGFDAERRLKIKRAYRVLFRQGLTIPQALDALTAQYAADEDITLLVDFVKHSQRGIIRMPEGATSPAE